MAILVALSWTKYRSPIVHWTSTWKQDNQLLGTYKFGTWERECVPSDLGRYQKYQPTSKGAMPIPDITLLARKES